MRLPWNFSRPGSAWVMDRSGIYVERGADEPRYQWTPDGRSEGLLIERQAQNYVQYSTEFSNPYWEKGGCTIEPSDVMAPDGTPSASLLREDTSNDNHRIATPSGTAPNEPHTATRRIFFKYVNKRYVWLSYSSANAFSGVGFDLIDMQPLESRNVPEPSSLLDVQIRPAGDGWLEAWLTINDQSLYSATNHSRLSVGLLNGPSIATADRSYQGDGSGAVLIWEASLDKAAAPSSIIPTNGTPITRPADTLYADMSLVPGFDPTKGTIVVEWDDIGGVGQPFQVSQTLSENPLDGDYWRLSRSPTNERLRLLVKSVSGSSQYTSFSGDLGPRSRAAVRWEGENFGFALNGSMVGALVYDAGPLSGLRFLRIGQDTHALYRHVQYIPQAVSDAQLQQLSSLNP